MQTSDSCAVVASPSDVAIVAPSSSRRLDAVQTHTTRPVGYITMTADLMHEGHFHLLQHCRARCNFLIVGLVTDQLAVKQKRVPIQDFAQRRAVLANCKYVDDVVDHNGEPKAVAWQKLKFDILFSSDEYYESKEFEDFEAACPFVSTIYVPRPLHKPFCTSKIIETLFLRMQANTEVLVVGFTGNIVRQGFNPHFVSKPIHFAWEEDADHETTADIFGFYHHPHLPRNWKSQHHCADEHTPPPFPMIAGINSHREIAINKKLRHKSWCTFVDTARIYARNEPDDRPRVHGKAFTNLHDFAEAVAHARKFPSWIVQLIQRDGGETFETWCKSTCRSTADFARVVKRIEAIINDLRAEDIVHGDIHPRNVLVDKKENVSIIDFGWAMSRDFIMCPQEREHFHNALDNQFDQQHFEKSMVVCQATRTWLALLPPRSTASVTPSAHVTSADTTSIHI